MSANKARLAAVLLALVGLGAGGVWHHVSARPNEPAQFPVTDAQTGNLVALAPNDVAQVKPDEANPARLARKWLAQRIDLPKGIEANTPLKDVLEFLGKDSKVNIVVDANAFTGIGVQKVEEQPVQLSAMKNVRRATVLRLLLGQLKGDVYTGGYLVRADGIKVTTTYKVLQEVLGSSFPPDEEDDAVAPAAPGARPAPLPPASSRKKAAGVTEIPVTLDTVVHVEFDKRPLNEALKELAESEGVNIVIDPRVGDKAKLSVTATLNNALFDTAVRVLTEMADLKVVRLTNVLYVTTPEKAAVLGAEQSKRRYRPETPAGGPQPGA